LILAKSVNRASWATIAGAGAPVRVKQISTCSFPKTRFGAVWRDPWWEGLLLSTGIARVNGGFGR
jgi:hypothetical protein